mgnify:CR=1 FL=1
MNSERDILLKLMSELKEIYNNRDFVVGVMSIVRNIDDRKRILGFIETNKSATDQDIL